MTRVTLKDITCFIMFNLLCISMQIALITSEDSTNNKINSQYYSNNKSTTQNDFNDLFSDDTSQRSLRHYKDEDDINSEEPMTLVEGSISNFMNEHHQHSQSPSPSPSPDSSINIIDDHNDHTEDDIKYKNNIFHLKTPTSCIVMPQEIDHCKHCEHPKYNSGVFKYNPSNHYCDIKYEMINEIITCPQGWEEHVNYRSMKKYAEHYFKCTSQKVCCLYN